MTNNTVFWKSYEIKDDRSHDWLMKVFFDAEAKDSRMSFTTFDQQAAQFYSFEISYGTIDKALKSLHVLSSKEQISDIISQVYSYVENVSLLAPCSSDFCFQLCFLELPQEMEVSISIIDELDMIFRVPCNPQKENLLFYKELLDVSGTYLQDSQHIINELIDLVYDKTEVLHECRDMLVESGRHSFLDQLEKTNANAFDNFHYNKWVVKVMEKHSHSRKNANLWGRNILELDAYNLKQSPQKKQSPLKIYSGNTASKRSSDMAEFVNPDNTKKVLMSSLKANDELSSARNSPVKKDFK
ncbi:hypothetical protein ACO0QE_003626 [Hanseniaspora vineae]